MTVHELSVVLVNHDGAVCLPAALRALAAHTASRDVECLVVDSGSTDGSWTDVERHWSRARSLRFEANIGFCSGCNRGAEAARGRLLAFVNFDALVEPGWDRPLRDLLLDPSVAVATGLLLDPGGQTIEAAGLEIAPTTATYGRLAGLPRSAAGGVTDVTAASGALMMVRRDDFLALGGFYEPIFMYGEEADYCLRARGRVVFTPASAVRHEYGHAAGPRGSPLRLELSARNRVVNAARHLPAPALARALLTSAAFDVSVVASARTRAAAHAVLRGWRRGIAALPRERRARTAGQRRDAERRLASFRAAVTAYRRLGRPA